MKPNLSPVAVMGWGSYVKEPIPLTADALFQALYKIRRIAQDCGRLHVNPKIKAALENAMLNPKTFGETK